MLGLNSRLLGLNNSISLDFSGICGILTAKNVRKHWEKSNNFLLTYYGSR